MALNYVQQVSTSLQGSSKAFTLSSALGATPNLLGFLATFSNNAGGAATVTDSINGAYTRDVVGTGPRVSFFDFLGSGAGTPTVSLTPNGTDWFSCGAVEFSGTSVVKESTGSQSGVNSTTVNSGSVTSAGACIVFGLIQPSDGNTYTPAAGWTQIAASTDFNFAPFSLIYSTQFTGSINPAWVGSSAAAGWDGVTIAFRESGGGSPGRPLIARRCLLGVG